MILWGLIDFVSAMLCEIHADEAYYRLYGQYLAWGYFDHPPLVGLMTWLSSILVRGSSIVAKNLSVRLITVLLHMGTVVLTWLCIPMHSADIKREQNGFFVIAASMVMFSAYGFITAPDSPLLFFTALFIYLYKCYLKSPSWNIAILLGVSMAGMVYSKYICVLVIALVVLSNWRLVKDIKLWCAVLIGVLLTLPHLIWQYENDFPSIINQLVVRSEQWKALYTLEYIPNQLVVFNPLVYVLMWILVWKGIHTDDSYKRALLYMFAGFQIFFFVMTIRGHIEPHWTMVTSICAIVLMADEWNSQNSLFNHKLVRNTMVAMLCIVFCARVILCLNILPARTGLANKRQYYEAMHKASEGLPVVLAGSFQGASLYRFYYDDKAIRVRYHWDRRTQYDLLHLEDDWKGKRVCILRNDDMCEDCVIDGFTFRKRIVDKFNINDLPWVQ